MADLITFVEAATSTDERPCVLMIQAEWRKDYLLSTLARRYFKRIPTFIRIIAMLSKRYSYSEHIELFREACASLDLSNIQDDNWHP